MSSRQQSLVHLLYEKKFIDDVPIRDPLERVIQFQKKIHHRKSYTPQNYVSKSLTCVVVSSRSNHNNEEDQNKAKNHGQSIPIIKYLQQVQNVQTRNTKQPYKNKNKSKKQQTKIQKKKTCISQHSFRNSNSIFPSALERLKIRISNSMMTNNMNNKYESSQRMLNFGASDLLQQKQKRLKTNRNQTRGRKTKLDTWNHGDQLPTHTMRSTTEKIMRQKTIARVRQYRKIKKSAETNRKMEEQELLEPWNVDQEF